MLPHAGRVAKAVAAGRLIIKGMAMIAPVEASLDQMLEHSSLAVEFGVKGAAWAAAGAIVGYGANSFLNGTRRYGRRILRRSTPTPSPQTPESQKLAPNLEPVAPN